MRMNDKFEHLFTSSANGVNSFEKAIIEDPE